jgi:mRNA interferase MazF
MEWLRRVAPTRRAGARAPANHEQAGRRPALVVSADQFNRGTAGLVVVVPMTTRERRIPLHVEVEPPEGGVRERSFIKCEDIRSVAAERLVTAWGDVSAATISRVEDRIRILLDL